MISKIKSKYWTRTHKFGARVPKTIQYSIEIDTENGNYLWWEEIFEEIKNVRIAVWAFEVMRRLYCLTIMKSNTILYLIKNGRSTLEENK